MFNYYDDNGERVDLGSADLNAYIRVSMDEVYRCRTFGPGPARYSPRVSWTN